MELEFASTSIALVLLLLFTAFSLAMPFFKRDKLDGKHVLITGGSKGLGLSLAKESVRRGCDVTIVARNQADLLAALDELVALGKSLGFEKTQKIQALSADTTNAADVAKGVTTAQDVAGPVQVLICNAGISIPGLFIEQDIDVFQRHVDINYLGTVKTIKTVLPGMLARRQGHIIITTSVLSILGFAGYSSYAASKWALRGLADCLHNEVCLVLIWFLFQQLLPHPHPTPPYHTLQLQGTGVRVSVAYPPDTDTPGYANENLTKPELCKKVNAALGSELFSSDVVAKKLMRQVERGAYHLTTPDFGTNVLIGSMSSLAPKSLPLVVGVLLAPIVQVATSIVGALGNRAARKYNKEHGYPSSSSTGTSSE